MSAVKKTYPAKKAAGRRKAPLTRALEVPVSEHAGTWTAQAKKKAASSTTSAASAARKLAQLLGYSVHADVRYVRATQAGQLFEIVEVPPCM